MPCRFDSATQQFLAVVSDGLKAASDPKAPEEGAAEGTAPVEQLEPLAKEMVTKILTILSGDLTLALSVEFLSRNNHADKLLISNIKDSVGRNSITHNATVTANAMM